jgi:hypothetical protein
MVAGGTIDSDAVPNADKERRRERKNAAARGIGSHYYR